MGAPTRSRIGLGSTAASRAVCPTSRGRQKRRISTGWRPRRRRRSGRTAPDPDRSRESGAWAATAPSTAPARLRGLTQPAPPWPEKQILDGLLGDHAGAARRAATGVVVGGTPDRLQVEPETACQALVLSRNHRRGKLGRNPLGRHPLLRHERAGRWRQDGECHEQRNRQGEHRTQRPKTPPPPSPRCPSCYLTLTGRDAPMRPGERKGHGRACSEEQDAREGCRSHWVRGRGSAVVDPSPWVSRHRHRGGRVFSPESECEVKARRGGLVWRIERLVRSAG